MSSLCQKAKKKKPVEPRSQTTPIMIPVVYDVKKKVVMSETRKLVKNPATPSTVRVFTEGILNRSTGGFSQNCELRNSLRLVFSVLCGNFGETLEYLINK